jgi:hypothetical protein
MNSKISAVLRALASTFSLGLIIFAAGTVAAATTRTVGNASSGSCPHVFTTIQSAIAAASAGDTIQVCPGIYNELVTVDKTLTIVGAQAGVDARTRVVPVTSESVVGSGDGAFQIEADKVVIDGFTIQGVNNDPSAPPFTGLGAGVWTNPGFSGTQGGHQILNNIIQNNITGIELDNTGTFQTRVQFNLIRNNNNPGAGSGNGIQVNFGLNNALIDNNRFSGHTSSSVLVSSGGDDQKITISNNELVGGTLERVIFGSVDNSSITGNTATGSTSSGTIRLWGGNSGITITCNLLANGQRGIRVDDPFSIGPNSNITANTNNIQGNAIAGLEVESASYFGGSLDAKNNWWGSPTGPTHPSNFGGTGDKIIDPDGAVTFIPFLTSPSSCAAVPQVGPPTNKDQCKKDGWMNFNVPRKFKNQGDCVSFVSNGK